MRLALIAATTALSLLVAPSVAGAAAASPADTFRVGEVRGHINTCNGETVEVQGIANYTIKPNVDGTSTWHYHLHGEGIGSEGNAYVVNVVRQSVFAFGGGTETEVDAHEVLVSTGSAPNQAAVFHFDAATGEFQFDVICTG
jgi:hypothetical protein